MEDQKENLQQAEGPRWVSDDMPYLPSNSYSLSAGIAAAYTDFMNRAHISMK